MRWLPFCMMVLGLTMLFLLLIAPVVIVVDLLMEKFVPGALSALPSWFFLAVFFVAPLAFALISARSLWRQGVR
jgi:hypothetical protein